MFNERGTGPGSEKPDSAREASIASYRQKLAKMSVKELVEELVVTKNIQRSAMRPGAMRGVIEQSRMQQYLVEEIQIALAELERKIEEGSNEAFRRAKDLSMPSLHELLYYYKASSVDSALGWVEHMRKRDDLNPHTKEIAIKLAEVTLLQVLQQKERIESLYEERKTTQS